MLERRWDTRSKAEISLELGPARKEAEALRRERAALDKELATLRELKREKDRLEAEKLKADHELAIALRELDNTKEISAKRDEKITILRARAHELESSIREKERCESDLKRAKEYLEAQLKLSLVARARGDYEREILRLSAEQRAVVESFKGSGDFLLCGAAGTGKTIVLLKCLEKLVLDAKYSLSLEEAPRFKFLTYANALRNYDAYLWKLLGRDKARMDEVETVDSLLRRLFTEAFEGKDISYDARALPPINRALESEIVQIILEGGLDRNEYIRSNQEHTGAEQDPESRLATWVEFERAFAPIEGNTTWPTSYAYWKLIRHYESHGFEAPFDYVFLDEAQDLSPAQLKLIKRCCKRGLIMAADADQAIYKTRFSYAKLGIELKGRSRILKGNYRNTIEILELAEAFRNEMEGDSSPDAQSSAWRHGPKPDIHPCPAGEIVDVALSSYEYYVEDLGYAPETIVIAAPKKETLNEVRTALGGRGVEAVTTDELKSPSFDFSVASRPRLITLQSCKGLDFSVAILILDGFFFIGPLCMRQVYVGLTRPMEQLTVIFDEDSTLPVIEALKRANEKLERC